MIWKFKKNQEDNYYQGHRGTVSLIIILRFNSQNTRRAGEYVLRRRTACITLRVLQYVVGLQYNIRLLQSQSERYEGDI